MAKSLEKINHKSVYNFKENGQNPKTQRRRASKNNPSFHQCGTLHSFFTQNKLCGWGEEL
jgi:hypothetical protein